MRLATVRRDCDGKALPATALRVMATNGEIPGLKMMTTVVWVDMGIKAVFSYTTRTVLSYPTRGYNHVHHISI